MHRASRTFSLSIAAFVLASCSASNPQKIERTGTINSQDFRRLFPLDVVATNAILADYGRVQSTILTASTKGAEADVSLLTTAGSFHFGHDLYYSDPPRTREIRDNYAAVQVGSRLCLQAPGEGAKCSEARGPLHLGLPEIPLEHVARIWSRNIPCDDELGCGFIKIQLSSAESDSNSMDGFSADPELVGHDYELVFKRSNYLPVYWKVTDHYHVGVTATAFYFNHRFGQATEDVHLPEQGGSIEQTGANSNPLPDRTAMNESTCSAAEYLHVTRSLYPASAVRDKAAGKATLRVTIGTDGAPGVISVVTSSGRSDLDAAAQELVTTWRFKPTICAGKPVARDVLIPVNFELRDDIANAHWEFAPDLQTMEKATAAGEADYLAGRADLTKTSRGSSEFYSDDANFDSWIITRDTDGSVQVLRLRLQFSEDAVIGLYASNCDGRDDWCSSVTNNQLEYLKSNPPPIPPQQD